MASRKRLHTDIVKYDSSKEFIIESKGPVYVYVDLKSFDRFSCEEFLLKNGGGDRVTRFSPEELVIGTVLEYCKKPKPSVQDVFVEDDDEVLTKILYLTVLVKSLQDKSETNMIIGN